MSFKVHAYCVTPVDLGHRQVERGERLFTAEFSTKEDRQFFKNRLRWSAFVLVDDGEKPPAITVGPTAGDSSQERAPDRDAPVPMKKKVVLKKKK